MHSKSKLYLIEQVNRRLAKPINGSEVLKEVMEKGKSTYRKSVASDSRRSKYAKKHPHAISRIVVAFGTVSSDLAMSNVDEIEDYDDLDFDVVHTQEEHFLTPMKSEHKKSSALRTKQNPVILREKLLELYVDRTSVFYWAFTHQTMNTIVQTFPCVRPRAEVDEWLHEKEFDDLAVQESFLRQCESITRNDISKVKNYTWKKNRYPPEEGKSGPPDQAHWISNSIEGRNFAKKISSTEQSGGATSSSSKAIIRMVSVMQKKYEVESNAPFVVRVMGSIETSCQHWIAHSSI